MFLKKFFGIFCLLTFLFLPLNCSAAKPSVAVIPFSDQSPRHGIVNENTMNIIRECVETDVVQTGKFRPLTRTEIQKLIDEIKFDQSGLVDPSTAAKYGKMIGAQYLIIGTVTGLGMQKVNQYVAHLSLRMIEVETAEIIFAGRGTGQSKISTFDALQIATEDALHGQRGMITMLNGGK